ncbi:hypothetical protein [Microbulbifer sp. Q7]|uniref:hypothetical protein n=1 Tax=Microbulbifer sp. Q7 TaxID=1785091 RepID=UPI000AE7286E|nr:hypothetical protein [Microbulbifer sp. Q7]
MSSNSNKQVLTNVILFILLCVCLWVGWSDFQLVKPEVTQEEIRESIRFYIRTGFQIAVQYLIPLAILAYFGKKLLNREAKT